MDEQAQHGPLEMAFARYERALREGDRQEVTHARLELCRLLEADGWTVPEDVRDQMARDERTLRALAEEAAGGAAPLLRVVVDRGRRAS